MARKLSNGPLPADPSSSGDPRLATDQASGTAPERCLICKTPNPRKLFFRDGKWFWICTTCELVFVHDIYPQFFENVAYLNCPERYRGWEKLTPRKERQYAALLNEFARYRKGNHLLEIGCSTGAFLLRVREAGWQCSGVEILPEVARFARERHSLDVYPGELADAGFANARFDVVYMNEVIEHVIDPVPLMKEVHRVLRPGGVALVRTGNARSWSARLRADRWVYYRFGGYDHIRYYNPEAARSLAKAAGFAEVRTHTRGFAFLESGEMRGRWFKPLVQLAQGFVSPLAGLFGAGHRLTMRFLREVEN